MKYYDIPWYTAVRRKNPPTEHRRGRQIEGGGGSYPDMGKTAPERKSRGGFLPRYFPGDFQKIPKIKYLIF